jgi:hypothetical protein
VAGIKEFSDLIFNGKFRELSPRCGRPRAAPIHGGPQTPPRRRVTGEWLERHPRTRNLATVEEKGGGAVEGRTRPGDGGEQPAEEALGGVDVADSGVSK